MSMQRKKLSNASQTLNILRGAIGQRNASSLRAALEYCKNHLPINLFEYAYLLATCSQQFASALPAGRKVRNTSRLNYEKAASVSSLQREFCWASIICSFSDEILKKFIPLRDKFFEELMQGNYTDSLTTLNAIDEECGKSLWVIENRILALSLSGGFELQKKYSKKLASENPRTNVAFYANYISERSEERVTYTAFAERLEHRLNMWDIDENHRDEIRFRLLDRIKSSENVFSGIIARQSANSAIDLYETLLTLLRRSKEKLNVDRKILDSAFSYLKNIPDWRIPRLKKYLIGIDGILSDEPIVKRAYISNFLCGKYEECFDELKEHLDSFPGDVEGSAYLAKVCSILNIPLPTLKWPASIAAGQMLQLFIGGAGSELSADNLNKLALSLRHSDISPYIFATLEERTSKAIVRRMHIQLSASIYLGSGILRLGLRDLPECAQEINNAEGWYEYVASGRGAINLLDRHLFTNESKLLSGIYGSMTRGDISYALKLSKDLEKSPHLLFRTEAYCLIPTILAQNLEIEEAIKYSVNVYLNRPELLQFTPLLQIIKSRGYRDLKNMHEEPFLAIAFQIYSAHVDASEKEVVLKVAWKNFLKSEKITRPSQLIISKSQPDFNARIYFLHEVCTQQTMELGGAFNSQIELDRERLQICVSLATINPDCRQVYDAEIIELTRRINLEEGATFLESSRVYVDEPGVLAWAKRNLESEFLRYLDFQRAGLFESVRQLEDAIFKILAKPNNKTSAITSYLDVYDLSAEGLLEGIIKQSADAFLSLPRYGLDSFLSSRIRHGSFVGYLRAPLEQRNLITKKDGLTSKYQDNELLLDRWRIEIRESRRQANVYLARFSEQVDSILDDAVARHLHVRGKLRPEGKIGFGTVAETGDIQFKRWTITAKATMGLDNKFEDLIEFCFSAMYWPSVRISLEQLQNYLRGEFRNKFTDALDDLSNALSNSMHESRRSQMLSDIHYCRIDLQAAIDRVALWFSSNGLENNSLSLSLREAIEVGLVATKNARPNFDPRVHWNICTTANVSVAPNLIRHINEISFLIFENASKHSGFEEEMDSCHEKQNIKISAFRTIEGIELVVNSEISSEKNIQDVICGIDAAERKIKNQEFDGITQSNKGTGLVRLAMNADGYEVSGKNSGRESSVKFGLTDNRMFYVRLVIGNYLLAEA